MSSMGENIKHFISLYSSLLCKRDDEIFLFGSWYGEKFADNPKYLFLFFLSQGKKVGWITKNEHLFHEMKKDGLPVYMFNSKEGIRFSKKAKYVFYCCSLDDVNKYYISGAILINLWHGVPLKKIMYDDTYNYNEKTFYYHIANLIVKRPFANEYVVSTSDTLSRIYEHAFRKEKNKILQLGQPRNDIFFNGEIKKTRYAKTQYSKLITYMPTMRNMGNDKIEVDTLFELSKLNQYCKENGILFLIKKHYIHRFEETELSKYSNIVDMTNTSIDTQELLYNSDVLITDYSSCYIDYLLLNRPILFYPYDLEEYLMKEREMYFEYDSVTPGPKVKSFDELMRGLIKIIDENDDYEEERIRVRDMFYSRENQGFVCHQILEYILEHDM